MSSRRNRIRQFSDLIGGHHHTSGAFPWLVTRSGSSLSALFSRPARTHRPLPVEDPVLRRLWSLGIDSSQVYELAQPLLDSIGPRLTGSPSIQSGNDWLRRALPEWGITAKNEQYGTWRELAPRHHALRPPLAARAHARGDDARVEPADQGQGRGQGHHPPRPRGQRGVQAHGCPRRRATSCSCHFPQPTCRPDSSFKQNALPATWDSLQATRKRGREAWTARVQRTGLQGRRARAGARRCRRGRRRHLALVAGMGRGQDLRDPRHEGTGGGCELRGLRPAVPSRRAQAVAGACGSRPQSEIAGRAAGVQHHRRDPRQPRSPTST